MVTWRVGVEGGDGAGGGTRRMYIAYIEGDMTRVMGSERWQHPHPTNIAILRGALKDAVYSLSPRVHMASRPHSGEAEAWVGPRCFESTDASI